MTGPVSHPAIQPFSRPATGPSNVELQGRERRVLFHLLEETSSAEADVGRGLARPQRTPWRVCLPGEFLPHGLPDELEDLQLHARGDPSNINAVKKVIGRHKRTLTFQGATAGFF
jgi:hypothetical protein